MTPTISTPPQPDSATQSASAPSTCWAPIDGAPKDGSEILGYREDGGIVLMRWAAPCDFATERELDELDEDIATTPDWFCADFVQGCRLDGDLAPTHWHPLPALPNAKAEP